MKIVIEISADDESFEGALRNYADNIVNMVNGHTVYSAEYTVDLN